MGVLLAAMWIHGEGTQSGQGAPPANAAQSSTGGLAVMCIAGFVVHTGNGPSGGLCWHGDSNFDFEDHRETGVGHITSAKERHRRLAHQGQEGRATKQEGTGSLLQVSSRHKICC